MVMRDVVAVIAGYLVFGISAGLLFGLSGRNPKIWQRWGFAAITTLYGMAFAFVGGWLTARIASSRKASVAVAAMIASVAILSMFLQSRRASTWTEVATVIFMAPCAALAGLRSR